jgi:hypothetical protein
VISSRAILPEQRPSSAAPIAFKTNSPLSILSRTCWNFPIWIDCSGRRTASHARRSRSATPVCHARRTPWRRGRAWTDPFGLEQRDPRLPTMMSACRHASSAVEMWMSSFTTKRQQFSREFLGFVTIARDHMQALQRKDASKSAAFEQRLVASPEDRQCFRFRSREHIRRHRIGGRSSIGVGSRSLDDRADPPVVLVDQKYRRAMAWPAFCRVVGPE